MVPQKGTTFLKIRTLFGSDESVVTIHGGMLRDERRKVEERFRQDNIEFRGVLENGD